MNKILVVGDLIIDHYLYCNVTKISPEAPVPIAEIKQTEYKLGGAGNVWNNIISMNKPCSFITSLNTFEPEGIWADRCIYQKIKNNSESNNMWYKYGPTNSNCIKTRIIGNDYHLMLRLDKEDLNRIPDYNGIIHFTNLSEFYIIVISDYAKNTMTASLIDFIFAKKSPRSIVIGDIKPNRLINYKNKNFYILKPNFKEHTESKTFVDKPFCEFEIVTVGRMGAIVINHKTGHHYTLPSEEKSVIDVTGAGDTFLAALTCCISESIPINQSVQIANLCAGKAVETLGTTTIPYSIFLEFKNKVLHEKR